MQSNTLTLPPLLQVVTLFLIGVALAGCDSSSTYDVPGRGPRKDAVVSSPELPEESAAEDALPEPIEIAAGNDPWIAVENLPWEAWYLQYLNGKRIGYSHVLVKRSALETNNHLIRIYRTDGIEVVNDGVPSIFKRTTESIEHSDGRLISLVDISQSSDSVTKTEGKLVQNTFTATTTIDEEVTTNNVSWEPGAWGLLGLQSILMRHPPQPGELLKAKVFIPQLRKIANAEMLAGQPELTTLPGGKTESLLPVDVMLWTEESGMRSQNWVNAQGEVLKTISRSGPNLMTFWTTPETGEKVRDEFELQNLLQRRVVLTGGKDLSKAQEVVYEVARNAEATGTEVYNFLAKNQQQKVVSINALSAKATVRALSTQELGAGAPQTAEEVPESSYHTASALIPADNPQVKKFAEELIRGGADNANAAADVNAPAATALRITRKLHEKLKVTPLDREVATPLQTIGRLQGDSVDLAILLTTLLRSQGFSARVASGLVIDPENENQMQFAMWTEVWAARQWLPLDATTGGLAGVDRLKVSDSDLGGENPYAAILPAFRELEGLEIKVISHQ